MYKTNKEFHSGILSIVIVNYISDDKVFKQQGLKKAPSSTTSYGARNKLWR